MLSQNLRIVTLLPSATEIVAALGLADAIVGRSHECDYPATIKNRPVCTEAQINSDKPSAEIDDDINNLVKRALSVYQVKTDVLEQLQPTHIVTQDQCDVCAVNFDVVEKAVAKLTNSQPQIISLQPNLLTEVWADIERVAVILGVESQSLLNQLQSRVETCRQKTQEMSENDRPTVACIEWTDPLMAAGNWIPELVTIAGGNPLFGALGKHSPYLEWDALVKANPDVIIVMPCGFDLERTKQETQQMAHHLQWSSLQAVRQGKVFVTDGNAYFNRPGPRLVDSVEMIAEILHPDLFTFGYQGTAWERFEVGNA
ncbi:MAG: cobalamin-binding protein [Moorea sp. SIO3I7]|uniref:cobalamin-binding protein n=1 Tax=Moorena sp. SIO3I8 TaxID=2607833 RepID=UPI0013C00D6A|nr:cobalamin-binding protein [Moorena sp. SIO3I8]NEN96116.1 cobalamin-binding protein [Moorena sp. SIO3I7]NEO05819.1 cobalamin-binding protein [Moorena sp. SIO3I8]